MDKERARPPESLDLSGFSIEDALREHDRRSADQSPDIAVFDRFMRGLVAIVEQDPTKAVELYTALAMSDDADRRGTAAIAISSLVNTDRDVALALWDRLIGDPDQEVRDHAHTALDLALEEDENIMSALEAGILGRTHYEAVHTAAGLGEGDEVLSRRKRRGLRK